MFDQLSKLPAHPLSQMYGAMARDRRPDKMDLGIGVYRDADGRSPIMRCIRIAMERLAQQQPTKEYLSPVGNQQYVQAIVPLIFGPSPPTDARICTFQTPGAGGGLRMAAELIRRASPDVTVWLPEPTWDFQLQILASAGVRCRPYPYYSRISNTLTFAEMVQTLAKGAPGDVVLFHGCCHNPSGEDPSTEEWEALSRLCEGQSLIPLIDIVYQGLGDGMEEDALGTRLVTSQCPESIVVASSSKTFGLYRDRAGSLSVVTRDERMLRDIQRHLTDIAGSLYFMPPDGGAALVVQVLTDNALSRMWLEELAEMRERIRTIRWRLAEAFRQRLQHEHFEFIARQKGMFSLLPLSPSQVISARADHGIYVMPDGRINLAALSDGNIRRVVEMMAIIPSDA